MNKADQGDEVDFEAEGHANPLRVLQHRIGMHLQRRRDSSTVSRAFRQPRNWRIIESEEACNNCACFPLQVRQRVDYDLGLGVHSASRVGSIGRSSSSEWR